MSRQDAATRGSLFTLDTERPHASSPIRLGTISPTKGQPDVDTRFVNLMGNNCHVTFDVLPSLLFPIPNSSLKWMRASRSLRKTHSLRKTKMSSRSHRRVSWLLSRSTPASVVRYCSRRTTGPTDDRRSQKKESTVLRDRHEDDSFHWPVTGDDCQINTLW